MNGRVVVIICGNLLRYHLQLQRLIGIVNMWTHEVVAVTQVALGEFDLFKFVFNHHLAAEQIVQWSNISVKICKSRSLLNKRIFSVEIVIHVCGSKLAGLAVASGEREGLAGVVASLGRHRT